MTRHRRRRRLLPAIRLGLQLASGSARDQQLRALSVLAAAFVGAVVLLATAAIAHSEQVQHPGLYAEVDNQRLLAAVVAAILFPVVGLAATVGRLSAALRDRRMANLRLLGMGRLSVRLVAAVETGVAAFAGALLGVLGFLVLRQPLSQVRVAGHGWPSETLWPPGWVYLGVVVLLPTVVMAVGAVPQRLAMADALARARRADSRGPTWWRLLPLALGVVLCGYLIHSRLTDAERERTAAIVVLFAGIILVGLGLVLVVPVFVRLLADLTLRLTDRPTLTVAARRLQAQPAGVSRVISGLLVGLFLVVGARAVVVAFESTPQYLDAQHQISVQQAVTVETSADAAPSQTGRARDTQGVRRVVAFPRLASSCRGHGPCLHAVVGTCAQLRAAAPDLRGCRDGDPYAFFDLSSYGIRPGDRLPPLGAVGPDGELDTAPLVHLSSPSPAPAPDPAAASSAQMLISADLLVPPRTPGVQRLVERAQREIVITGDPGRDLANRLTRHGVNVSSIADFASYDFVAQLRTLVWAIAAVILSIGMLAFAVAAIDRAVNRRREVTALQLLGVPRTLLRNTQWLEAAVPLALGCCLAIALGLLGGETYLSLDTGHQPAPWTQALLLAALAALGAALIAALTVVASSPLISPDLIRNE